MKPNYETVPGWPNYDPSKVRSVKDLPKELQTYIGRIEKTLGVPVVLLSTGPGREETLEISNPFKS